MKKVLLFITLVCSFSVFSQEGTSTFNYKAKFEGINDATKAVPLISAMKMVFKTPSAFNESTGKLEFTSKMSISQTVFNNMMSGEGFTVESFERQEIKAEVPVEIKKAPLADTTSKNKTTTVKNEVPKKTPTKTGK